MAMQIIHDPLHAGLARFQQAPVTHQLTDAGIVATILAIITNAYDAAIGQANTPAALHLQEEEFDRIGGPGDFQAASRQRARFNGRAVVIRNERRTLHLAADPLALQRLTELAQIDVDQIGGPPVNRCLIAPLPLARASDFRFEIRSEEHTSELQSLMRTSYAV